VSPLGFPDETFDAVYAYHVFEHLTPTHGQRCARQIFRALKPGGIWRISVPDLETACRDYLEALQAATVDPSRLNAVRYQWAVMAIFEQMVRDRTGGMMLDAIEKGAYDEEQLRQMFGDMLQPLVERRSGQGRSAHETQPPRSSGVYEWARSVSRGVRRIARKSRPHVANRLDPRWTKEAVQWMYDRLSLRWLLEESGFQDVRQVDHRSSGIAGWSGYDFDRSNKGGYPLDPSVYMEGRKPGRPSRDP